MIEEFCDTKGDVKFRSKYSGRGMFGKSCVGFVSSTPLTDLVQLVEFIINEGYESASYYLGEVGQDSMGFDTIVYFPNISMEE